MSEEITTAQITLRIPLSTLRWLQLLSDRGRASEVLEKLADHAAQGVYRAGAWERGWICNVFNERDGDARARRALEMGALRWNAHHLRYELTDDEAWQRYIKEVRDHAKTETSTPDHE